jgi:hypothetical protein
MEVYGSTKHGERECILGSANRRVATFQSSQFLWPMTVKRLASGVLATYFLLATCLIYPYNLKLEAVCYFKMLVNFYQTT